MKKLKENKRLLLIPIGLIVLAVIIKLSTETVHGPPPEALCASNLTDLQRAMRFYTHANNKYPTANQWCDLLLKTGTVNEDSFICPTAEGRCHYAINPYCEPNSPSDLVLLFETKGGWNQFGGAEVLTTENHGGYGCHVLFNNGTLEFVMTEKLGQLKWKAVERNSNSIE